MKHSILITILTVIFLSCSKSPDEEIKKNISSITVFEYSAKEENGAIIRGNLDRKFVYNYDIKGNLIKQINYQLAHNIEYKFNFIYDESGKMTEENFSYGDDIIRHRTIYFYDSAGYLTSENFYGVNGGLLHRYEYTNDEKGNQTVSDYYNSEGKLSSRTSFSYDAKNNMIEMKYHSPATFLSWRKTFTYNSMGKQTKEFIYDTYATTWSNKIMYEYYEKGNLTEQGHYGSDDIIGEKLTNKYLEFDNAGNWTIRNEYRNDIIFKISEREIEYY
jgi:hypothetical protein